MKFLTLTFFLVFSLSSWAEPPKNQTQPYAGKHFAKNTEAKSQTKKTRGKHSPKSKKANSITRISMDAKTSQIHWEGEKKIPGKGHKGTIQIKNGWVNLDQSKKLVGGIITIDMTSINVTDLSGKYKKKLTDHLNSDDFFDVQNHKEASFKITQVKTIKNNHYQVAGDLTIRGKTNKESFKIKIEQKGDRIIITGQIQFDRTKYGVSYNSESSVLKKAISIPKDKIIKDDILLTLHLQTQKIQSKRAAPRY